MTAVLSSNGDLVLPQAARDELNLHPGDGVEVIVGEDEIILRRSVSEGARDWLATLLACPHPFEIPEREARPASVLQSVDLSVSCAESAL